MAKLTRSKSAALELRPPEMRANLLKLLDSVQRNKRTRDAFIDNPTKLIASVVAKTPLSAKQASEANRLTFALIANDAMREWLSTFEPKAKGALARKQEFATAFAHQVASLKDDIIVVALLGNAIAQNGIPGLSSVAYQCVCNETNSKTSTTCTPVAKATVSFGNDTVTPEVVRGLSEALVARAKALAKSGALANLAETFS